MILVSKEDFSSKELVIAEALTEFLSSIFDKGKISERWDNSGHTIRVECHDKDNDTFVVQLLVSEDEHNSVNLTNILIPYKMSHRGIGTNLVTVIMNASEKTGLDLFITGFANDRWREDLIKKGAILYPSGSVLIEKGSWMFN